MISVTRLNGQEISINALLIETVEATPDTLITLTTGKKVMVLEKVTDVLSLIQNYMRSIGPVWASIKLDREGS